MLTFDNAAAKSALDKFNEQYGEVNLGVRRPIVKTLNAFGYQILKDHIEEEFFPIAQPYQLRNFVKDSLKSLEGIYPQLFEVLPRYLRYNYYIELFSLFKNELFDPFELDAQDFADFILERDETLPFFDASTDASTAKIILQAIIWLYQAYNYSMKDNNLIKFDPLLIMSVKWILMIKNLERISHFPREDLSANKYKTSLMKSSSMNSRI